MDNSPTENSNALIFGLRFECDESSDSDFDDVFGDNDIKISTPSNLSINNNQLTFSLQSNKAGDISSLHIKKNEISELKTVKNFEDVNPYIKQIIADLGQYCDPGKFDGKIDFIPIGKTSEELVESVNKFYQEKENGYKNFENIASSNKRNGEVSESVVIQIDLIRYSYNPQINIKKYIDSKLIDSRIMSLLFYLLATNENESNGTRLAFIIRSIVEFLKSPSMAPISVFFPKFNYQELLSCLCEFLTKMFPHHPLLPSILHNISDYTENKPEINENLDDFTENSDLSSDFSSSFFEGIVPNNSNAQKPLLSLEEQEIEINPLDLSSFQMTDYYTVPSPPSTLTYKINSELTPKSFTNWLKVNHPKRVYSRENEEESQHSNNLNYPQSFEEFANVYENINKFNFDLFTKNDSKNSIPSKQWALFFPIFHYFCSSIKAEQFPLLSKMIPKQMFLILKAEFNAHIGFETKSSSLIEDSLNCLLEIIGKKEIEQNYNKIINFDITNIIDEDSNCPTKRRDKYIFETKLENHHLVLMALADISLIMDNRSPFSLKQVSGFHPILNNDILNNILIHSRAYQEKLLLYKYIQNDDLPPYISFRVSFSLGCFVWNLIPKKESQCFLSSRFFVEAISVILDNFNGKMKETEWVKLAFLQLGESLNSCDRYYYAALCLDNGWGSFANDSTYLTKIAKICQKRQDNCRAAFFYYKALLIYHDRMLIDEALYTAQIIASIYKNNEQLYEGICLLLAMIDQYYKVNSVSYFTKNKECSLIQDVNGFSTYQPKTLNMNLPKNQAAYNSTSIPKQENIFKPIIEDTKPDKNKKTKRSKTAITKKNSNLALSPAQINDKSDSINVLTTVIALIKMLLKCNYFALAESLVKQVLAKVDNPSIAKIFKYLKAVIFLKQNNFDEFLNEIKNIDLSSFLPSKSRPYSIINKSLSIDVLSKSLKKLYKGYLERKSPIYALFWSEVAIKYSNSLKVTANALLYRGKALAELLKSLYLYGSYLDFSSFGDFEKPFGQFKPHQKLNRLEILEECLSSLSYSSAFFDRIGNPFQTLEGQLCYCEAIIFELFRQTQLSKNSETNINFQVKIDHIGYFLYFEQDLKEESKEKNKPKNLKKTKSTDNRRNITLNKTKINLSVAIDPYSITKDNVLDHLDKILRSIFKQSKMFMYPIFIIRHQILFGELKVLTNNIEDSKKFFNFALSNLQKYFFNGQIFLLKNSSLESLRIFNNILKSLALLIIAYDSAFINSNLIIFDMQNNLSILLRNRIKLQVKENISAITSSLKIPEESILKLMNPSYPDFEEFQDETFIPNQKCCKNQDNLFNTFSLRSRKEKDKLIRLRKEKLKCENSNNRSQKYKKISMIVYLHKIKKNIYQFYEGYLTERKMIEINSSICKQLEFLSSDMKLVRNSLNLSELPPKILDGALFLYHISCYVIAYFPCTGESKITDISESKSIRFLINQIPFKSSAFTITFLQMLATLINASNEIKKNNLNEHFKLSSIEISKIIFGNNILTHIETALSNIPIPDDQSFVPSPNSNSGQISKSIKKGALSTLNINVQPLTIIAEPDLQILPFELMFPKCCVLRSNGFFNFYGFVRSYSSYCIMKPVICQCSEVLNSVLSVSNSSSSSSSFLKNVTEAKSNELIQTGMSTLGACMPPFITAHSLTNTIMFNANSNSSFVNSELIDNSENAVQTVSYISSSGINLNFSSYLSTAERYFPFDLFMYSHDSDKMKKIKKKYKFLEVINVTAQTYNKINLVLSKYPQGIFIFTYGDLVDYPLFLEKLINYGKKSSFMFVPVTYFHIVLKEIQNIFERHIKRKKYFESNPKDSRIELNDLVLKNSFQFLTTLQMTLIEKLKIPIPIMTNTRCIAD